MKAIRIATTGDPDVLQFGDTAPPVPGLGDILIRHTAIGLNFSDVYYRLGAGGVGRLLVQLAKARATTGTSILVPGLAA